MKKFAALLLALCLAISCAALAEEVDTFTSASVTNYYGLIEGDELMNALNSYSGFYIVTTVNPDGSANAAFFIYGCIKLEDKYYLQLGLAPNQTTQNLEANGCGVAVYAPVPTEGNYPTTGARMTFTIVTDPELRAALTEAGASSGAYMGEITAIVPIG